MPELPEVETIRHDLSRFLLQQKISQLKVSYRNLLKPNYQTVRHALLNRYFTKVSRRGKLLILSLSSGKFLLIHLKMTGQLVWQPVHGKLLAGGHPIKEATRVPNRFTHITLVFKNGARLYFNDVRRFGYWRVVDKLVLDDILAYFGPEPLSVNFNPVYFRTKLQRKKRSQIKNILLDQQVVAGIGNIYADESLWQAKIKPIRRGGGLSDLKIKQLYRAIRLIIKKAVEARGTSFSNYVDGGGREGTYWEKRKIYRREGLACYRCGTMIKKVKVNGRGTHYCPQCQV